MTKADDAKTKLRKLRDQLAWETPRAKARASTPPALIERLEAAGEVVGGACRMAAGGPGASGSTVDELIEDAIVEGHLALHEWERFRDDEEQKVKRKPTLGPPLGQRRQHERHETNVSVSVLRHGVRTVGSSAVVGSDAVQLRARNLSAGGIMLLAQKTDLPAANVGSVVHVALTAGDRQLHARAVVTRRDDAGIALRWLAETDVDRRVVDAILAASRPAR